MKARMTMRVMRTASGGMIEDASSVSAIHVLQALHHSLVHSDFVVSLQAVNYVDPFITHVSIKQPLLRPAAANRLRSLQAGSQILTHIFKSGRMVDALVPPPLI